MSGSEFDFKDYKKWLANVPHEMELAAKQGLLQAAHRLAFFYKEEIQTALPHPAVDTGGLLNSVQVETESNSYYVEANAPHAAPINNGTRPFWPPEEPIRNWVLRKGIAEDEDEVDDIVFAIRAKFSREGMAPRHFREKAEARLTPKIIDTMVRKAISARMNKR